MRKTTRWVPSCSTTPRRSPFTRRTRAGSRSIHARQPGSHPSRHDEQARPRRPHHEAASPGPGQYRLGKSGCPGAARRRPRRRPPRAPRERCPPRAGSASAARRRPVGHREDAGASSPPGRARPRAAPRRELTRGVPADLRQAHLVAHVGRSEPDDPGPAPAASIAESGPQQAQGRGARARRGSGGEPPRSAPAAEERRGTGGPSKPSRTGKLA